MSRLLRKILVANRGEIACRIIHTARKLGVETVAIYSDIDRHSKFVDMAHTAYRVGANPSAQSYLNQSKILEIAKDSGCEGLHPGFGFLSENAGFAKECAKQGLRWIGPPSEAITAMGSKSESKKIMTKAGVPVVPGYHGEDQSPQRLFEEASNMQYPVLIKAVSGGGGKGMRIVREAGQFLQALDSCKREALKAFSDDRVLVEKYITRPRHIEVQVFGDQLGNYVHLYERDCSIQRRHQKVVEEAPSNLNDTIRQSIYHSAVEAARAVGYYNAGTVEFIFDLDSNKHYFMEMNTRLQVEHPISEMITGLDFVEWQLLVASGFPLPRTQQQIQKNGHAIEARIYAEDPFNNFLPATGTLKYFKEPKADSGVRIETGVREKDTISTFYDPMIAKLVTYGSNRNQAIRIMQQALKDYRVVGPNNNLRFLKRVLDDPVFQGGEYDTSFIENNEASLLGKTQQVQPFLLVAASVARDLIHARKIPLPSALFHFRNVPGQRDLRHIRIHDTALISDYVCQLQVDRSSSTKGSVSLDKKSYQYEVQESGPNHIVIVVEGQVRRIEFFGEGSTVHIFDGKGDKLGVRFESDEVRGADPGEGVKEGSLMSPMPGTVTRVFRKVGDEVKRGQSVIAMQAMKMELVLKAEFDCRVVSISAAENTFVEAGKVLVQLQPL